MKSGICPKCQSNQVHSGDRVPHKEGAEDPDSIVIDFWSRALLVHYVCTSCGYVESYITNPRKLEKINRTWPYATGAPPDTGPLDTSTIDFDG